MRNDYIVELTPSPPPEDVVEPTPPPYDLFADIEDVAAGYGLDIVRDDGELARTARRLRDDARRLRA